MFLNSAFKREDNALTTTTGSRPCCENRRRIGLDTQRTIARELHVSIHLSRLSLPDLPQVSRQHRSQARRPVINGLHAIAICSENEERATRRKDEWKFENLPFGYGLSIEQTRQWGLYVSKGIKPDEPELFSELTLFSVRPNLELYAASIQTMSFTRPSIDELIGGFSYIIQNGYPDRGEA